MYISEQEVREVLTYEALIPAIRQALMDYSAGLVEQPARMVLRAGNAEGRSNGWFAVMPVIAGDVMAVKTVTFYPANDELGLHTHMAIVELLLRATGEPLAVMDGRLITEMRTAAVSAVALDAIGGADVRSLGIVGSGVQARAHLQALRIVRPSLKEILIHSRTERNAAQLAAEVGGRVVPISEAAGADVVLTVTSATAPVVEGRWLRPNAVVLAVGATGATMRELDDEVMRSSFIVAESQSCAERESGDVRLSGTKVEAEVGQILSGAVAALTGRRI
ncbi:MAG: ornithine cyclodeaminase family protein, partial [Terracidiphilus sp.]|nr:ornithine cyclodeaminase family protein [Terracidiphilus sp.]